MPQIEGQEPVADRAHGQKDMGGEKISLAVSGGAQFRLLKLFDTPGPVGDT